MTNIKEQIVQHRRQMKQKIEAVRQDERLSDEGRRQAIHKLYSKGLEIHYQLVERYHAERDAERERLHKQLFGPTHSIGTPEFQKFQRNAEFRLALQEVDQMVFPPGAEDYNVEGLERYLERAELAGDTLAAKAAFAAANEKGLRPVVDSLLVGEGEVIANASMYR